MAFTRYQLMRRAVRLWSNPLAPREINRYNRVAWLAAVERLGASWLFIKKVQRETPYEQPTASRPRGAK